MIILITGASHTGKTALAQKLLEKYQYPYLSIDLLKGHPGYFQIRAIMNKVAINTYVQVFV